MQDTDRILIFRIGKLNQKKSGTDFHISRLSQRKEYDMTKANRKNKFRTMICMIMIMMWVMATALPAMAAAKVQEAQYQGYGKVEVDFTSNVKYQNAKVTVKDSKGVKYAAVINRKDSDDLTFTIKKFKKGMTYYFTIHGIKRSYEKNFGTASGKIWVPGALQAPRFKKAEYDSEDLEVEFDFYPYIEYKNPKITITYGGKNYAVRIIDRDNDSFTVKVRKLTRGRKYNFAISGIRVKGNTTYTTEKGVFTAR